MRILKLSFLLSGLLFLYVIVKIPVNSPAHVAPAFEFAITALGLAAVVAAFMLPRFLANAAAKNKAQSTSPSTPIQQWFSRNLVALAFLESCSLYGVALHFAGARVQFVAILFTVGLTSLLLWTPEAPPSDEAQVTPQDGITRTPRL